MSCGAKRQFYFEASAIFLFMLNFMLFQQVAYAVPPGQAMNGTSLDNLGTPYIICQSNDENMNANIQETSSEETAAAYAPVRTEHRAARGEKGAEAAAMAFVLMFYPTIILLYIFGAPFICACVYIITKVLRGGRRPAIG